MFKVFLGALEYNFVRRNKISKKIFLTKSFITPVFLGLMPLSLVLFKGQTVVYKLFSK